MCSQPDSLVVLGAVTLLNPLLATLNGTGKCSGSVVIVMVPLASRVMTVLSSPGSRPIMVIGWWGRTARCRLVSIFYLCDDLLPDFHTLAVAALDQPSLGPQLCPWRRSDSGNSGNILKYPILPHSLFP